ncbi:tetratricopeptide repeat protein [Thiomonas sp.]
MKLKIAIASALLSMACASVQAANFDKGLIAYARGDYTTALHELQPLAEQGDAQAQYTLGLIYVIGRGVPQDYAMAAYWYRKAAEQGHAGAQFNLGLLYDDGRGVPQNYAKAIQWYRKAAEQGDAKAQALVGLMYEYGRGVLQDYVQAHKWLNIAASNGDEVARKERDKLVARMTPGQIQQAQFLASEWAKRH